MTKINIYDDTAKKLKNLSYNIGEGMAEILEEALQEYIENNGLKTEARTAPDKDDEWI